MLVTIKRATLSSDFKQIWDLSTDFFITVPNIKYYGNPYSGSGTDGQTDRWIYMAKLINSFRDSSNAPGKLHIFPVPVLCDCGVSLRVAYWRTFGLKGDEYMGGWGKLHYEALHNLYSLPNNTMT